MYGISTYIWVIFRANCGKYSIHGAYGNKWHFAETFSVDPLQDAYSLVAMATAFRRLAFCTVAAVAVTAWKHWAVGITIEGI